MQRQNASPSIDRRRLPRGVHHAHASCMTRPSRRIRDMLGRYCRSRSLSVLNRSPVLFSGPAGHPDDDRRTPTLAVGRSKPRSADHGSARDPSTIVQYCSVRGDIHVTLGRRECHPCPGVTSEFHVRTRHRMFVDAVPVIPVRMRCLDGCPAVGHRPRFPHSQPGSLVRRARRPIGTADVPRPRDALSRPPPSLELLLESTNRRPDSNHPAIRGRRRAGDRSISRRPATGP